jgi:hypothetical protein
VIICGKISWEQKWKLLFVAFNWHSYSVKKHPVLVGFLAVCIFGAGFGLGHITSFKKSQPAPTVAQVSLPVDQVSADLHLACVNARKFFHNNPQLSSGADIQDVFDLEQAGYGLSAAAQIDPKYLDLATIVFNTVHGNYNEVAPGHNVLNLQTFCLTVN